MLFDSHCHLNHSPLIENLPQVIAQAAVEDINQFLVPATQPNDWYPTLQLSDHNPQIHTAIGIHPWFIATYNQQALSSLEQILHKHPQALIGEIGLDFRQAKEQTNREKQIRCFETQLQLANVFQRPIIIHNVHATHACLHSIKRCAFKNGGFVHGFSGSIEEAREWIKYGFMISIGSLLLRQQAKKIHLIAQHLPLQHIALETDAPYMPPQPGQHNSPNNLRIIAQIVADLHHCTWHEIAQITTQNTESIINRTK